MLWACDISDMRQNGSNLHPNHLEPLHYHSWQHRGNVAHAAVMIRCRILMYSRACVRDHAGDRFRMIQIHSDIKNYKDIWPSFWFRGSNTFWDCKGMIKPLSGSIDLVEMKQTLAVSQYVDIIQDIPGYIIWWYMIYVRQYVGKWISFDARWSQEKGASTLYLTPVISKSHFEQHPKSSGTCCLVVGVRAQNPVKQQVSLIWPPIWKLLLAALSPGLEHHQKSHLRADMSELWVESVPLVC